MRSKAEFQKSKVSFELIVKPEAEKDIQVIFDWYESKVEGLGERFLGDLDRKLSRILDHPEGYQFHFEDFRFAFLDRFPVSIHFKLEENTVFIFGIFPTSKNPDIRN